MDGVDAFASASRTPGGNKQPLVAQGARVRRRRALPPRKIPHKALRVDTARRVAKISARRWRCVSDPEINRRAAGARYLCQLYSLLTNSISVAENAL